MVMTDPKRSIYMCTRYGQNRRKTRIKRKKDNTREKKAWQRSIEERRGEGRERVGTSALSETEWSSDWGWRLVLTTL
jgi:hypothetical protein